MIARRNPVVPMEAGYFYVDKSVGIPAPKGLESIAQGLPWVCCFFAVRPVGALEVQRLRAVFVGHRGAILAPLLQGALQ